MSETNPGINQENIVAPVSAEAEKAKELLNKERVGLQAVLLMDAKTASSEETVKALTEIRSKSDAPNLETITKSSKFERDNYWKVKQNKDKEPMSFDEQKSEWISSADQILGAFRSNSEQETLLKKLGYDKNKGAKEFYEEFFVEGKGNLGFFGKKIAESFTEEDLKSAQKKSITIVEAGSDGAKITREISLLDALGGFYGQKSSEVARLVAEGMSNLKNNEEEFKKTAGEQVTSLSDNDRGLLANIAAQSGGWVKNENARLEKVQREQEEKRRKEEEEAKKNSPEGLAKQVTEIYDRISKSDKDLVKHFLPVLEAFKAKPKDISDDVYKSSANAAIEAFIKAEGLGDKPEDEQLINIISLFDSLSLHDFSKLQENDKNFVNESKKNILQKLKDKDVELLDINNDRELMNDNAERVEQEVGDGRQVGDIDLSHPGFKRAGKVIRKPIFIVYTEKKGAQPDGIEPGADMNEEITKNIGKIRESIDNSDHDFIKHFSPVLQSFEKKPAEISDKTYKDITINLLSAFSRAESMSNKTEKDQAMALIFYLDMLSFAKATWELSEDEIKFIEKKESEFINLLAGKDIKPIDIKQGDNYDPDKMDANLETVNDESMVDKVIKVHFRRGFTTGQEVLRRPRAIVGKKIAESPVVNPDQNEGDSGAAEQEDGAGATTDGAAKEGQGDNPPATEEQELAEPAQDAQNQPQAGGVGEQAQPAQAEAIPGDASPQAVAGGSDEQAAIPTTGHATPEDPDRIAKGQQEIPTQDQINAELARAVLLADGRDLNEEEKVRIKEGEKADEVIKKTNLNSVTPNNDN